MTAPRETWHFNHREVGRRVLVFDRLESTNSTAAELALNDPDPTGLAIVAEYQSAGRGQYGRVWQSQPGRSLLLTAVLHPPPELRRPVLLTAVAAVAVGGAVYSMTGLQASVKWPNDLLVRGKKICGLLIEQHAGAIVVGIGLNLNQSAEELQAMGLPDAASLRAGTGTEYTICDAAEVVLRHLDENYRRLLDGERTALEAEWKWRVGLLGRQVTIEMAGGGSLTGRLFEMGFDGLEIDVADGLFRVVAPEAVTKLRAS